MNNQINRKKDLRAMPSLLPAPILVVGSFNEDRTPNIMTVSFAGIVSARPPALLISIRKTTQTYANIKREGVFTINVPTDRYAKEADFIGLNSGKDVEKFEATRLTSIKSENINAPYVKEFPVIYECKVINSFEIGSHTQFVGEILNVKADENVLDEKEKLNIEKVNPITMGSSDGTAFYYSISEKLAKGFSNQNTFIKSGD